MNRILKYQQRIIKGINKITKMSKSNKWKDLTVKGKAQMGNTVKKIN